MKKQSPVIATLLLLIITMGLTSLVAGYMFVYLNNYDENINKNTIICIAFCRSMDMEFISFYQKTCTCKKCMYFDNENKTVIFYPPYQRFFIDDKP